MHSQTGVSTEIHYSVTSARTSASHRNGFQAQRNDVRRTQPLSRDLFQSESNNDIPKRSATTIYHEKYEI